jgi:hypothetical protein
MFLYQGKKININQDLVVDDVVYSAGSLLNAELRDQLGIIEIADPVRPDDRIYWIIENDDGTYSTTEKPRDLTTPIVWSSIQAKRDRVKVGGVKVNGFWFHTDSDSRIQFIGIKTLGANFPNGVMWKTMSGELVEMTLPLVDDVISATASLDISAHVNAENHKALMEKSKNPFEYDFSSGWPETFDYGVNNV